MKPIISALWLLVSSTALAQLPRSGERIQHTPSATTAESLARLPNAYDVKRQTIPGQPHDRKETTPYEHVHLTVGPEFAYYPAPVTGSQAWVNDSTGFGMKQNVGASLRVDYLFLRRLGLSLTAGYAGWELLRRYTRNGVSEYTETKRLTQIPVQLGLKAYPFGQLYLMPEVGTTLLFTSVKTSGDHPTPADESVQSMALTYGASLGYEIRAKALLIDLSARYHLMNVNNLNYRAFGQMLNERVSVVSIRLGIGLNLLKK